MREISLPREYVDEEWRDVPGYVDRYSVSSYGRVWSHITSRILKQGSTGKGGYKTVVLCRDGHRHPVTVQRILTLAFYGPRSPDTPDVRHLNGDPADNRLSNLRYGTKAENVADSLKHGTQANARKTRCPLGHKYTLENTYHERDGSRKCKACRYPSHKAWYQDHRTAVSAQAKLRNDRSKGVGYSAGQCWTEEDIECALDESLTYAQVASLLGRTIYAVKHARRKYKQHSILSAPASE